MRVPDSVPASDAIPVSARLSNQGGFGTFRAALNRFGQPMDDWFPVVVEFAREKPPAIDWTGALPHEAAAGEEVSFEFVTASESQEFTVAVEA
ncbi:hypothetical protein [Haloarchaeobius sp. DFWS5]|uniref:hypothetical protein n=1 Tax=Haloarchaeobius sp. DFWS5 TaxID=3446114 RepID=UPI003EC091F7